MAKVTVVLTMGLLIASMKFASASQKHVLKTSNLSIEFENGIPVHFTNLLTGESFNATPGNQSIGLLWQTDPIWLKAKDSLDIVGESKRVQVSFYGPASEKCSTIYSVSPDENDILVIQSGQSNRKGLYGIQWGISGISDESVTLIVPTESGYSFNKQSPLFSIRTMNWPQSWESAMVLIQMQRSGFLVWTKNPEHNFKALFLSHLSNLFEIGFQTQNFAPFEEHSEIKSVEWRITAYKGDWRVGAEIYRKWMAEHFKLTPLEKQQPSWVKDIRFVVIAGMETGILDTLTKYVVPERTLLYIPGWRRDGYDKNYPDYTASPQFGPFVEYAHKMGFKVMPHVNYFGCDPKNPEYEKFKQYQFCNPFNKQLEWWVPPLDRDKKEPDIKFAYIHPGCKEWRQLLVSRFKEIYDKYKVDALHLDQTQCIINHAYGFVDGVSAIEGNLLLHKELREALPEVALSGEGLDEVTLPYESFAQRHTGRALNFVYKAWNEGWIKCCHPISSYLFLPYNVIYGYLGMTGPTDEEYYRAWKRIYENWGVIPTLARPGAKQFENPSGELALLLEEAGQWTKERMLQDFTGDWSYPVKFRHKGENKSVVFEKYEDIGSVCFIETPKGRTTFYRYVGGVNILKGRGTIDGWVAYNEKEILGLNPESVYLYLEKPRDMTTLHVSGLPPNAVITESRLDESKLILGLLKLGDDFRVDFCERIAQARAGTVINKEEGPIQSGATFGVPGKMICGGKSKTAISAHPAWQQQPGKTFGEYRVEIPAGVKANLSFYIGLRDGVSDRSDGVNFSVEVNDEQVFEKLWKESKWDFNSIDLSKFTGKEVRIKFITDPGPENNPSFDWCAWGEPVLNIEGKRQNEKIEITSPLTEPTSAKQFLNAIFSKEGRIIGQPLRKQDVYVYSCEMSVPSKVAFVWQNANKITYSADLATSPFSVTATISGRPARLPTLYVSTNPGEGTSKGEKRKGLTAHPPNYGRVYADFLLELPEANKVVLTFAVALQDGSKSDGCRFIVEANLKEIYSQIVTGPDGWHPAEIDITEYAGKTLLLSLIVDSEGPYNYDWARWAEPKIITK